MKVLFDHQIFSYQRFGGVSKYFAEMLSNFPLETWETTTLFSNNEYVKNKDLFKSFQFFPRYWFKGQGRIMNELNKPYSIYRLAKQDYDVFHQTHFETYCLPYLKDKPMVTTFHDMNFATYNKNEYLVKIQKLSINRANKIIAVSQNTRKDLIEMWNVDPDKIEVVYHGVDTPISDTIIGNRLVKEPYILYVGRRETFKNFERLLDAFALIDHQFKDLRLVCTSENFTEKEILLLQEKKIYDKVIHIRADEKTMANLYKYAELFVYPSIYEGFGMPILEAMSYGCPVVISNTSCFPEIAKDAAVYFDPYNTESIVHGIEKAIDSDIKRSCIDKGYERCKDFSWKRTADGHLKVYKSLL